MEGNAGQLALAALAGFGVDTMFTLNGGHVWPLYDAAVKQGVRIVDTRHEQTATWAAEGWAKLRREPGPRQTRTHAPPPWAECPYPMNEGQSLWGECS
jgi:hypothetical protein